MLECKLMLSQCVDLHIILVIIFQNYLNHVKMLIHIVYYYYYLLLQGVIGPALVEGMKVEKWRTQLKKLITVDFTKPTRKVQFLQWSLPPLFERKPVFQLLVSCSAYITYMGMLLIKIYCSKNLCSVFSNSWPSILRIYFTFCTSMFL